MTDAPNPLECEIDVTLARLRAMNRHGDRARLAALSGVKESSLRGMACEAYDPLPLRNLKAVRAALDDIERSRGVDAPDDLASADRAAANA
jgi:hypothetical protein